jgi:hypothetical protein
MVDGEDTEEEPSQEKIHQKSIDQQHMLQDGLLKISLPINSVEELWFKSPIVLVFQSL